MTGIFIAYIYVFENHNRTFDNFIQTEMKHAKYSFSYMELKFLSQKKEIRDRGKAFVS